MSARNNFDAAAAGQLRSGKPATASAPALSNQRARGMESGADSRHKAPGHYLSRDDVRPASNSNLSRSAAPRLSPTRKGHAPTGGHRRHSLGDEPCTGLTPAPFYSIRTLDFACLKHAQRKPYNALQFSRKAWE